MATLRDELLRFVNQLREAGVRVSVAETIDAMNAILASGLERTPMREALAATLIKDEDDRHIFDEIFATFFASSPEHSHDGRRKPGTHSSAAPGAGNVESEAPRMTRDHNKLSISAIQKTEPRDESESKRAGEINQAHESDANGHHEDGAESESANEAEEAGLDKDDGSQSGRRAQLNKILRTPFERYADLEYDQ